MENVLEIVSLVLAAIVGVLTALDFVLDDGRVSAVLLLVWIVIAIMWMVIARFRRLNL